MNNFEEMKKFARWRARKIGKWCLFGLCIVGLVWGFIGIVSVTDAAFSANSFPWTVQIGIVVAWIGWIIGGIIASIWLAIWASED